MAFEPPLSSSVSASAALPAPKHDNVWPQRKTVIYDKNSGSRSPTQAATSARLAPRTSRKHWLQSMVNDPACLERARPPSGVKYSMLPRRSYGGGPCAVPVTREIGAARKLRRKPCFRRSSRENSPILASRDGFPPGS